VVVNFEILKEDYHFCLGLNMVHTSLVVYRGEVKAVKYKIHIKDSPYFLGGSTPKSLDGLQGPKISNDGLFDLGTKGGGNTIAGVQGPYILYSGMFYL